MLGVYLGLMVEIVITYSEIVCYIFMIVSMMRNAGFISLIYPFAIFGFALMEELKPKRKFWYFILIYTEVLIFVKFIY